MHLTLQQLRLFESVARLRNFTRAAEELFLTQPAVSIQIKRLEDSVGLPLFEQIGKRIYLTEAGQAMYQAVQDVLGRLETMKDEVLNLQGVIGGPLRISVVTTAKYFMPHLLGAFLQAYPRVEPHLSVTNREKVIQRLTENKDDMVIMGHIPDDMNAETHPFLENTLVVVASPQHPLARSKRIPLQRIAEERLLVRESGSGTRQAVERLFVKQQLEINPYMELGSSEAIKQGVMAGLGISVLSLYSLRLELAGHHVSILDVEGFPLRYHWHAVHLKGKKLSLAARTFLEFILKESSHLLENTTANVKQYSTDAAAKPARGKPRR